MSYRCRILLDSISETGKRITTFELTYPRIIHSEFMTHRMFSRNAASSRAIPAKRMREMVLNETFIPDKFPRNIAGMQPTEWISEGDKDFIFAKEAWLQAAKYAVEQHEKLEYFKIHKQIANRLLEPFLWYTCIVTATEFDNFFKLRCDENAQYEIRRIADLMYEAYHAFDNLEPLQLNERADNRLTEINDYFEQTLRWSAIRPQKLKVGEWHCPLVYREDDEQIIYLIGHVKELAEAYEAEKDFGKYGRTVTKLKKKISVARCARVSYLTHDGKRDIEKDLELFERLRTSGHWSPFEHVATPYFKLSSDPNERPEEFEDVRSGNFIGWKQFRKEFQDENCAYFRK